MLKMTSFTKPCDETNLLYSRPYLCFFFFELVLIHLTSRNPDTTTAIWCINLEYGLNYYEHAAGNHMIVENCVMPCTKPQLFYSNILQMFAKFDNVNIISDSNLILQNS